MKKIIVPMDFTEVAINAFQFAQALFPSTEVHVVHATFGLASTREPIYLQAGKTKKMILKEELERQLVRALEAKTMPDNVTVVVMEGETVPSIVEYVEENDIDGMVMGTRDKYDIFDRWIGTVSLGLVKTLKIPTYLVPRYAKYKGFEKIIVASDHHLKNRAFIEQIKSWNTDFNAFIRFLHIYSDEDDSFDEEKAAIVEALFETEDATFGFDVESVFDKNISKSLLGAAYNFGADLLLVIPDNQTFINSLLFRSVSKELILQSNIPLLFLHPEEEEA